MFRSWSNKQKFLAIWIFLAVLMLAGFLALYPPFTDAEYQPVSPARIVSAKQDAVNLNTACAEELCLLEGIGPVKANAILAYRTENGAFHKKEDLLQVQGVNEKLFVNIQDFICVE